MSYSALGISIGEGLDIARQIAADPYLTEFVCEARRLDNVDSGRKAGSTCQRTRGATKQQIAKGVGLRTLVGPMRAYTYHLQHPWVYPAAITAVFAMTYYVGFKAGKRKRR